MRKTAKKPQKKSEKTRKSVKKGVVIALIAVVLLAAAGFAYANTVRHQTPDRIVSENGALYCYSKADEILTDRWISFEGNKYYAGEDGKLYTGGMQKVGEDTYYFGEDGACFRNIFKVEDKVYSADHEGRINMTEGWEDHESGTYYNKGDGECLTSCITDLEGGTFSFDPDGLLRKDTVFEADGGQYYADPEGKIAKSQPVEFQGNKYYASETGAFVRNGYTATPDCYYYINNESAITKEPFTLDNGYTVTPDPETGAISKKEHDISISEYIFDGLATYIKVDIGSQSMIFVKDGELLVSSYIVSGMYDKYDTPRGEYEIINKARDIQLKGEQILTGEYEEVPLTEEEIAKFKADPKNKDKEVPKTKKVQKKDEWDVKVNYWLAFIGGTYGFHDATWRSYFGDYIYVWDGSHGCVNLPLWAAETLYNNAEIGTPVFIDYYT